MAAKAEKPEIIKILLRKGSSPNALDNRRRSAIFYAVENGDFESVKALVDSKASVNQKDNRRICIA